jgi:hypothetical protein
VSIVAKVPARTGICCGHKLEIAGKDVYAIDSHDPDLVVLERLTQRLQCICRELRKLVQEEHAAMRQRDLPRHDGPASTNKTANRN